MIGLLVGKFYPPHKGHLHIIALAAKTCKRLYVVVGGKPDEKIPPSQRVAWLQELTGPNTVVIGVPDNNPPGLTTDDPAYWTIWRDNLLANLPESPHIIFGSEAYVITLAHTMRINYALLDPQRQDVPISATQIRADPKKYWEFLPTIVQSYYTQMLDKNDKV